MARAPASDEATSNKDPARDTAEESPSGSTSTRHDSGGSDLTDPPAPRSSETPEVGVYQDRFGPLGMTRCISALQPGVELEAQQASGTAGSDQHPSLVRARSEFPPSELTGGSPHGMPPRTFTEPTFPNVQDDKADDQDVQLLPSPSVGVVGRFRRTRWPDLRQVSEFLTGYRLPRSPGPNSPGSTASAKRKEEAWERGRRLCKERIAKLKANEWLSTKELEEEFTDLLHYKNRFVKARLLHYAVWHSWNYEDNAAAVRLVLEAGCDVRGKAMYTKDGKENQLEAIHIAAGLGCVPAMRALVERVDNKEQFLNAYCVIDADGCQEKFYTPVHDAAYLGRKDAVVWLLENRACASTVNRDGFTPLHWLAFTGLENEGDLDAVVRALLKHKARLDAKTKEDMPKTNMAGKIPLELAVQDESRFPRRLMHLLAPSFQGGSTVGSNSGKDSRYSFFDDMCLLSSHNTDAANQLAKHLLNTPDCHQRVRIDAQRENAVDRMANLFHMAPDAAADMLDILMVKPMVQDAGRHPIRSRASLWGMFRMRPMRCAYQADSGTQDNLRWPQWRYDSTKPDDKELNSQPELKWHLQLVNAAEAGQERREYVDDVETKALLLPNIIDVDIFMALACTRHAHSRVFSRTPVQGIIYCLWDHIALPVLVSRILFQAIEVAVLSMWGLANYSKNTGVSTWSFGELLYDWRFGEDTNSPTYAPVSWTIVAAGLFRDAFNLAWWCGAYMRKYYRHLRSYQQWKEKQEANGGVNNHMSMTRPPSLHSLWRPQAFLSSSVVVGELPLLVGKLYFIWGTRLLEVGTMSEQLQAALAAITLFQFFKMVYMLRLTIFGKQITTILRAFFSGAITEMLGVTAMFFASVCLAFSMFKHKQTAWAGLFIYRGLLFGDGDALNYMGLDPTDMNPGLRIRTFLMLLATSLFNIVILNLTIAIYSSEYDRLAKEAELHFQRERAKCCCELLLGLQKIGPSEHGYGCVPALRIAAYVAPLLAWLALQVGDDQDTGEGFSGLICYLKCCPKAWLAAILIGIAEVAAQAVWMQSHWFPSRTDGNEGPKTEHFLWICHHAGSSQDIDGELDLTTPVEVQGLSQLEMRVQKQIERLDEKVEGHINGLNKKLDTLTESLAKLLPVQSPQRPSRRGSAQSETDPGSTSCASPPLQRQAGSDASASASTPERQSPLLGSPLLAVPNVHSTIQRRQGLEA